jgi:DNA transformation protein and related proteins
MGTTADAFAAYCVELLEPLGGARARRMFGGHGLYVDDLFIAIVADEQLYLKADASTRPQFEAAGCRPFVYSKATQAVAMSYWSAPEEATESPSSMLPWARLAQAAALRARAAKPPSKAPRSATVRAATTKRPRGAR